jgi:hypothetical protein
MDFWTLLAISLAVLWAQANVISCAGLQALRAEARVRWEALVSLDRCLLECRAAAGGVSPDAIARWRTVLEKTILPENAPGVLGFYEERRLWIGTQGAWGFGVLELRCRQAAHCYAEVAALYNRRISSVTAWPLSRWMGFAPVQEPPREDAVA